MKTSATHTLNVFKCIYSVELSIKFSWKLLLLYLFIKLYNITDHGRIEILPKYAQMSPKL